MTSQHILRGRPTRLAVLDYGLFKVHANGRVIGICGYLVETDAGERVLFIAFNEPIDAVPVEEQTMGGND